MIFFPVPVIPHLRFPLMEGEGLPLVNLCALVHPSDAYHPESEDGEDNEDVDGFSHRTPQPRWTGEGRCWYSEQEVV